MTLTTADLSFSDIDSDLLEQAENYIVQLLKEEYPSLDLTKSRVIRDEVVRPAAIAHVINREDNENLRRSFSPVQIQENPDLADQDIVDSVYSNYRVSRFEGARATGVVALIISSNIVTAVPEETVFTANGLSFVLTQPYIGVTTRDSVISSSERLIESRGDGTYVFTVPVVAAEAGEQYRIERGTQITATPPPANLILAESAQDFTGGLDTETNAELIERVQAGIAPAVFSGRIQNQSLISSEIDELKAISQVGLGDAEMLRDRKNIFEVSNGGKTDLYVQTADTPEELKKVKECTYMGSGVWQAAITRDDMPGFYLITSVLPKGAVNAEGSLEILSDQRGLDLTLETDFVQDIQNQVQGAYTRYQTSVLRFADPSTSDAVYSIGAKVEYDVYLLGLPKIKEINDLTVDRDRRPPGADYLPRAAVPALMSCTLLVQKRPQTADPDEEAIKQAVASRVNSLKFRTGRVPATLITAAAQSVIEPFGSAIVTPIDMAAFIYPPDTAPNDKIVLRDANELRIPDLPARGVSQRTTCFFLRTSDISVSIQNMDTLAV